MTYVDELRALLLHVFEKSGVSPQVFHILTSDENMKIYTAAFTTMAYDPTHNYEYYEQIGDGVIGSFIVQYLYRRFPMLQSCDGVKVVSRIKIKYASRNELARIGESLGLWPMIRASEKQLMSTKKDLIEDVFEAFIGATVWIADLNGKIGDGFSVAYSILKTIFDRIHISFQYEDLFDAKTRLKEVYDMFRNDLGLKVVYNNERMLGPSDGGFAAKQGVVRSAVMLSLGAGLEPREIGVGISARQIDAEQKAAEKALKYLEECGYSRAPKKIVPAATLSA